MDSLAKFPNGFRTYTLTLPLPPPDASADLDFAKVREFWYVRFRSSADTESPPQPTPDR